MASVSVYATVGFRRFASVCSCFSQFCALWCCVRSCVSRLSVHVGVGFGRAAGEGAVVSLPLDAYLVDLGAKKRGGENLQGESKIKVFFSALTPNPPVKIPFLEYLKRFKVSLKLPLI